IDALREWKKCQQRRRLAITVKSVLQQRSRFDAREVVNDQESYDWRTRVACHYRLVEERAPVLEAEAEAEDDDFDLDEDDDDPAAAAELRAMTLPPRPEWTDRYAGSSPDERFFDVAALMERHGLDRARAVELQNHFRDLTRAEPEGERSAQYAEALRRAQAGEFEDGRDPERLARARFIVVFDLDATLYDQSIDDAVAPRCHDLEVPKDDGGTRPIKLTPGWADAIHRIHELGGEVVLFSANLDDRCYANARAWMLDGVPIHQHPAVAGLLTNSHLVLQPKQAGVPVVEPSKDLRILDPELQRVIIVDDNPRRLFQFRNVRVFKKFDAEAYCAADRRTRKAYDASLRTVVDEIEDALRYMDAHRGTSFADAYLPYTMLGQVAVRWIQASTRSSERAAIAALRAEPGLADADF
ncbi:MAG: hypothetical protein KDK70_30095, partial [Myxococcales bacterium]|nr:hypothetical protein [Myxococcales bacterium]